jgi:hypothetical protein
MAKMTIGLVLKPIQVKNIWKLIDGLKTSLDEYEWMCEGIAGTVTRINKGMEKAHSEDLWEDLKEIYGESVGILLFNIISTLAPMERSEFNIERNSADLKPIMKNMYKHFHELKDKTIDKLSKMGILG